MGKRNRCLQPCHPCQSGAMPPLVVAAFNQEKALVGAFSVIWNLWEPTDNQGRHCPTLAGMARVETPVSFAHLISFLAIFSCFLPLCHRILPIVSPVFEIFKTPGIAIAIPAILVSPPLSAVRCDWGRAGRRFDCDNKLDCTDQDLNSLQLVVLPSRPANNRIYFWQ